MNQYHQSEPWRGLLADAAPRDHIVQLYQDQEFLSRAVCRFAAAALAHGEGLIPVEDYARLERAVADALRETVGPVEASLLEKQLLARYTAPFNMPQTQALLLALRETRPLVADTVLERSRTLYAASGNGD